MTKSAVVLRMSETGSNSADTASLRGLPSASADPMTWSLRLLSGAAMCHDRPFHHTNAPPGSGRARGMLRVRGLKPPQFAQAVALP